MNVIKVYKYWRLTNGLLEGNLTANTLVVERWEALLLDLGELSTTRKSVSWCRGRKECGISISPSHSPKSLIAQILLN
jgi:hypothetical protein